MDMKSFRKKMQTISSISKTSFWITTDELCNLLEIPDELLSEAEGKYQANQFYWRNFLCSRQLGADNRIYWCLEQVAEQKLDRNAIPLSMESRVMIEGATAQKNEDSFSLTTATTAKASRLPFVHVQNVFDELWVEDLLSFVSDRKELLVGSTTSNEQRNYRNSHVLYEFAPFSEHVIGKVKSLIPDVLRALDIASFPISEIECQLTQHNDGDFYRIHNDCGSPNTATRTLTYVYYFHRQPKGFRGGDLRIYDTVIKDGHYEPADSFHLVEPCRNSLLFFPSYCTHEVLPVNCQSGAFEDSRFTINGWIRRQG